MQKLMLAESPRLYVSPKTLHNLPAALHTPYLQELAGLVQKRANVLIRQAPVKEGAFPTYQPGTRLICNNLETLTATWALTKQAKYRKAAMRHLAGLAEWNQISCEANPATPPDTVMPFCLSYGELCAVVGLMYDFFHPDMTATEKEIFNAILDKFLLRAALNCLDSAPWWANKSWSNWNGVCAGGIGIMALAIYDDRPAAQKLIPFVEKSLAAYFQSYIENGGGCHEGTGYWNYGMNYAMRYLLSAENATGKQHPALEIPELGTSLFFPLDFSGITFGDNDGWGPTAFYFLLAKRLGMRAAAMNAAVYLQTPIKPDKGGRISAGLLYAAEAIPDAKSMELLRENHTKRKVPVARVYQGMDWAALADDESFPALRLALRGGSSKVAGHGMLDLLSIRCRLNGELMITDQQDGGYMATTFTKRGNDLYGRSAASKSTLFVDGLGCMPDASCDSTAVVKGKDWLGIRSDGSHIYIPRWKDVFIGRLVIMVDKAYWLVIDRVQGAHAQDQHWLESRFHTTAQSKTSRHNVQLKSGKQNMNMTFASLHEGVLQQSYGMPSQPQVLRTTIYRWMSTAASHDQLHVTALTPGTKKPGMNISRTKSGGFCITVEEPTGHTRHIRLTADLRPAAR